MKEILLADKRALDIHMNPRRQQILRVLALASAPMTPKQLSVAVGISASCVQHHVKQLPELGVIELDHVQKINAIDATYYRPVAATISFAMKQDGVSDIENRLLMTQSLVNDVMNGYSNHVRAQQRRDIRKKPV